MIHSPRFKSFRRAAPGLVLAVAFVAVAAPAHADNPPRFADPEVATYFQQASDLIGTLASKWGRARVAKLEDADWKPAAR